ncbi:MAG: hypothetical protein AB1611_19430 [bacterium]
MLKIYVQYSLLTILPDVIAHDDSSDRRKSPLPGYLDRYRKDPTKRHHQSIQEGGETATFSKINYTCSL